MGIIGLIPARGGSKSIPHKNVALCANRPLLYYTAKAAFEARVFSQVILSTDDSEIAQAGRDCGLAVPFMRPNDLAGDASPMLPVMQHALGWLRANNCEPEGLVLLQPTSPLRRAKHIIEAVDCFRKAKADTLVSIMRVPHRFTPTSLMRVNDGLLTPLAGDGLGPLRRQDKEIFFARNGPAILIVSPRTLDQGSLYGKITIGYEMDERSSLDVDEPEDLALAEVFLRDLEP